MHQQSILIKKAKEKNKTEHRMKKIQKTQNKKLKVENKVTKILMDKFTKPNLVSCKD